MVTMVIFTTYLQVMGPDGSQVSSFPAHCVIKASAGAERLAAVKPAQLAAATWTKGPSATPRLEQTGKLLRKMRWF